MENLTSIEDYTQNLGGLSGAIEGIENAKNQVAESAYNKAIQVASQIASAKEEFGGVIEKGGEGLLGLYGGAKGIYSAYKKLKQKRSERDDDDDDNEDDDDDNEDVNDADDMDLGDLGDVADSVGDEVSGVVSNLTDTGVETLSNLAESAGSQVSDLATSLEETGQSLLSRASNFGQSIMDNISQGVDRATQGLRNNLNDPVSRYNETGTEPETIEIPESETLTGQSETLQVSGTGTEAGSGDIEMTTMGRSRNLNPTDGEVDDGLSEALDTTGEEVGEVGGEIGAGLAEETGLGLANLLDFIPIVGEVIAVGTAIAGVVGGAVDVATATAQQNTDDTNAQNQLTKAMNTPSQIAGKYAMPSFDSVHNFMY